MTDLGLPSKSHTTPAPPVHPALPIVQSCGSPESARRPHAPPPPIKAVVERCHSSSPPPAPACPEAKSGQAPDAAPDEADQCSATSNGVPPDAKVADNASCCTTPTCTSPQHALLEHPGVSPKAGGAAIVHDRRPSPRKKSPDKDACTDKAPLSYVWHSKQPLRRRRSPSARASWRHQASGSGSRSLNDQVSSAKLPEERPQADAVPKGQYPGPVHRGGGGPKVPQHQDAPVVDAMLNAAVQHDAPAPQVPGPVHVRPAPEAPRLSIPSAREPARGALHPGKADASLHAQAGGPSAAQGSDGSVLLDGQPRVQAVSDAVSHVGGPYHGEDYYDEEVDQPPRRVPPPGNDSEQPARLSTNQSGIAHAAPSRGAHGAGTAAMAPHLTVPQSDSPSYALRNMSKHSTDPQNTTLFANAQHTLQHNGDPLNGSSAVQPGHAWPHEQAAFPASLLHMFALDPYQQHAAASAAEGPHAATWQVPFLAPGAAAASPSAQYARALAAQQYRANLAGSWPPLQSPHTGGARSPQRLSESNALLNATTPKAKPGANAPSGAPSSDALSAAQQLALKQQQQLQQLRAQQLWQQQQQYQQQQQLHAYWAARQQQLLYQRYLAAQLQGLGSTSIQQPMDGFRAPDSGLADDLMEQMPSTGQQAKYAQRGKPKTGVPEHDGPGQADHGGGFDHHA